MKGCSCLVTLRPALWHGHLKDSHMDENTAALEANTCHKIKHHFGDFSLPQHRFLKEQIKLDEGWVPLEIMIKFNR